MTKAITRERWVVGVAVAALLLALAIALARAPGAGAGPSRTESVDVVGAGTIVWKKISIHAQPTDSSKQVAELQQFRADYRPQYVLALSEVKNPKTRDATWYRISLPGRPNGRTGWVRAAALDLHPVHKRLIIFRGARRFEFWNRDRLVRSGKVAVGKPGAETPLGLFYVTWKFNPSIDPSWAILGAYAFETSAYSKLTDWPGGGIVGVHGTPWPSLLGQAVSHGCVRVANQNIVFLRSRVPLGTPIKIVR
jgi:lipoprotein-anchoring transpeptidase ErfK/SrfK